jgi:replication factor C small subunit
VTNVLQTTALHADRIEEDDIYTAAASLRPEEINEIMESALSGDFMEARETLSELMIDRGLDGQDVIGAVNREVLDLEIGNREKMELIEALAEFEFRIAEGGSDDIQIEALLAKFAEIGDR